MSPDGTAELAGRRERTGRDVAISVNDLTLLAYTHVHHAAYGWTDWLAHVTLSSVV